MFSDHFLLKQERKYTKIFEKRNSETNHFIILISYKQVKFVLIMYRKMKMDFRHKDIFKHTIFKNYSQNKLPLVISNNIN